MKNNIAFLVCAVMAISGFAQDVSLRMHDNLPQSRYMMPQNQAMDSGSFISLPSAAFHVGNSGFSYNDLVKSQGDSAYLDFPAMIAGLRKNNYLNAYVALNFISLGRRFGNWQVSVNHAQRLKLYFRYTDEMARFLWYGNKMFEGETVNLAPDFEAINYFETSVNTSYALGRWKLGATLKYLEGKSVMYAEGNQLAITTAEGSYDISIDADFRYNAVNQPHIARIQPFPKKWLQNPGWGVDLGLSFKATEALTFSASLIDLGRIWWKQHTVNLTIDKSLEFAGVDLSDFILGDSFDLKVYDDSLQNFLSIDSTSVPFTSSLIPRLYFSSHLQLNPNWSVGFIASGQGLTWNKAHIVGGVSVKRETTYKNHVFSPTLHYTYRNRSPYGLGISMAWRYRFIEVYGGGDNLFAWFLPKARVPLYLFDKENEDSLIIPKGMRTLNFRFAVNFYLTR